VREVVAGSVGGGGRDPHPRPRATTTGGGDGHRRAQDLREREQPSVVEEVLEQHHVAGRVAQRHLPVGVLLVGARLVLGAPLPHRVGERDTEEHRGGLRDQHVQRLDELSLRRVLTDEPALDEQRDHRVPLLARLASDHVGGLGQQAQPLAQVHVLSREVSGGGRKVVRGDRGEREPTVVLGGQRAPTLALLEPQDGRAEDATLGQVVADPGLEHPEVLADHDRPGALRLEAQDPDQRLVVVADVGSRVGARGSRDPPEPEQPDDVVDPDRARVPQHGAQQVAVRGIARPGESLRVPRRLRPVLTLLVVHVRWRPDGHAAGEHVAVRPRVRAVRVHAHREVVHDADRHPGLACRALRDLELLVRHPLEPAVEVDLVVELLTQRRDPGRGRVERVRRPVLVAEVVRERAPGREVLEPLALLAAERVESRLARGRARRGEHDLERGLLGLPRDVAVDRPGIRAEVTDGVERPLDERPVGRREVPGLPHVLDADVQRVDEAPARGQVGRGRHGGPWLGRGQRVHEHEVRTGPVRAEPGEVCEVRQVPDPPRGARAHRVELRHESPGAPSRAQGVRELEALRRHDERRARLRPVARRVDLVPPQGQVLGDGEGRPAHGPPVDRAGLDVVVDLRQVATLTHRGGRRPVARRLGGLELDPHLDLGAVRDVHGEACPDALSDDERGRQHLAPRVVLGVLEAHGDLLGGRGGHPERFEHRDERLCAHGTTFPVEPPEVGRHSVDRGQLDQRFGHVGRDRLESAHEAILPEGDPLGRPSARRGVAPATGPCPRPPPQRATAGPPHVLRTPRALPPRSSPDPLVRLVTRGARRRRAPRRDR
jgi:hypothetical protein